MDGIKLDLLAETEVMILFAVILVVVILVIIGFFVFAGRKKKEGQDLGEHR
jgi:hypothetical protein